MAFRGLIDQLDSLNSTLDNVSVVKKPPAAPDDDEPKATFNVLSSAHVDAVKDAAARHGWTVVELEPLFSMAKFEKGERRADEERSRAAAESQETIFLSPPLVNMRVFWKHRMGFNLFLSL